MAVSKRKKAQGAVVLVQVVAWAGSLLQVVTLEDVEKVLIKVDFQDM